MNRIEAVASASLVALVAVGLGQKYKKLSQLAETPSPVKNVLPRLSAETRPERTMETEIALYVSSASTGTAKQGNLDRLLTTLESPEFDGEEIDTSAAESLSSAIVAALEQPGDGGAENMELRRRAVDLLASRVPGKTSRDFVLKALDEGPVEVRLAALKRVGSPTGVQGSIVYLKIRELGEKGLVPDSVYPAVLRRTGGVRAKNDLVALMTSTDNAALITGCALALQDYRDPQLIGNILERLEAVGMIDRAGKLPWISSALLNEYLKSADKTGLRRGMIVMGTRPLLVKTSMASAGKGLQSPDPDARRHAAVAVKKAVLAKFIDAKRGEALLASQLQVETQPVLKAELMAGLDGIRSFLKQQETGVQ